MGRLALGRVDDPALPDARALHDPLVRGLHEPFEVGVGESSIREFGAGSGDAHAAPARRGRPGAGLRSRVGHSASWWAWARCSSVATWARRATMASLTPTLTNSRILRIAARMVRASLEPWAMMYPPLTPRSG